MASRTVPIQPATTTQFLRDDFTWQTPPGGGGGGITLGAALALSTGQALI